MKFSAIISLAFLFASCSSDPGQNSTEINGDSSTIENKQSCFLLLEGAAKRDTSSLQLQIMGDSIKGTFNHIPYEKDSRRGTIAGIKRGDTIKALWSFMQEGMIDTLSVEFLVRGEELYQKTFGTDISSGRQKLTDTSTFSIKYKPVDCAPAP